MMIFYNKRNALRFSQTRERMMLYYFTTLLYHHLMRLAVDAHHVDAVHGHRDAVRLSAVKQRAAYAVDLNRRIGNSFYDYLAAGGSHRHAWRADLADRAFTRSDFREITPLGSCFISVNTSFRNNKLARSFIHSDKHIFSTFRRHFCQHFKPCQPCAFFECGISDTRHRFSDNDALQPAASIEGVCPDALH